MPKKGYIQTEEHKEKRSESLKGNQNAKDHKVTKEVKQRMSSSHIGKIHSEEHKRKIRENSPDHYGEKNPMFGRKLENCPAWKGGISFSPYCYKFNKSYKESIREKYGRICVLCGKTEEENNEKLCVHHTDYNKRCDCDGNDCICVPLCRSCHTKTNHNRDYWEELIIKMINNHITKEED